MKSAEVATSGRWQQDYATPKKLGEDRLGWRCLADTLSLPEVLGWGAGKENQPLTFAPHP